VREVIVGKIPPGQDAIDEGQARRGAIAATARFSSTTGDGAARAGTSYSPTICVQSVAAAVGASACTAAMAAWSV
jgi:hypothetical protein